jgi:hypothetical protein
VARLEADGCVDDMADVIRAVGNDFKIAEEVVEYSRRTLVSFPCHPENDLANNLTSSKSSHNPTHHATQRF